MKRLISIIASSVAVLALTACSSNSTGASGENYPDDDITMIVSYAAGGPTDISGRAIAQFLETDLDTSVVVENVEGASGAIGTAKLATSKTDGLTIATTSVSAISRVPIVENVGYAADDVIPLGVISQYVGVVFVKNDSPYETIDDLVAAAKKDPQKVTIGTQGALSPQAVEIKRMISEYSVPVEVVPFQGDAPATTALLGDNVDAIVPVYTAPIKAQHEAGAIRPLAVMGPERVSYLPDVPTLAESGFDELKYGVSLVVLAVPKGTPTAITERLEGALRKASEDEETREKLGGEISLPDAFIGSKELSAIIDDEVETLGPVLKKLSK